MNESLLLETSGLRVSRETMLRLSRFVTHFEKWSKAINLAAQSTHGDIWTRHVADSAQLFVIRPDPIVWVDIGSGGGFPGLITAILLSELNGGWVHLVESNQKKASFLRSAILETGARASVHAVRIEAAYEEIGACDAISARALADLKHLLAYSKPWLSDRNGCRGYFHKGRDYAREIDDARSEWNFDLVKHSGCVEKESVILEIANLQKCPRILSESSHERTSKPDNHGSQSKGRGRKNDNRD